MDPYYRKYQKYKHKYKTLSQLAGAIEHQSTGGLLLRRQPSDFKTMQSLLNELLNIRANKRIIFTLDSKTAENVNKLLIDIKPKVEAEVGIAGDNLKKAASVAPMQEHLYLYQPDSEKDWIVLGIGRIHSADDSIKDKMAFFGYTESSQSFLNRDDPLLPFSELVKQNLTIKGPHIKTRHTKDPMTQTHVLQRGTRLYHGMWSSTPTKAANEKLGQKRMFFGVFPIVSVAILLETWNQYNFESHFSEQPIIVVYELTDDLECLFWPIGCDTYHEIQRKKMLEKGFKVDKFQAIMALTGAPLYSRYYSQCIQEFDNKSTGRATRYEVCVEPEIQKNILKPTHLSFVDVELFMQNCRDPNFQVLDTLSEPIEISG